MLRLFVDSSVLFSAIYSSNGHSADLLRMGILGEVIIVLSDDVVDETHRNLAISKPERLPAFEKALAVAGFEIIDVSREEVMAVANHVVAKDAPILAAAKMAKVDMLVITR